MPQKVGILMQGIALAHAFTDGNKRTAWTSSMVFLRLNNAPIYRIPDSDGLNFVDRVIKDRIPLPEIATWFAIRFEQ